MFIKDTYRGSANDPLSLNLYTYCSNNPIIYWDPTGHWQQGDSNKDVDVQLALMQLSDEWNNAKTKEEKTKFAQIAKEVREQGSKHEYVTRLIRKYFGNSSEQLAIMNSLEVVDKELEAKAFTDGIVTKQEWAKMRNISSNLMFKRGNKAPIETYSGEVSDVGIKDDYGLKKGVKDLTWAKSQAIKAGSAVGSYVSSPFWSDASAMWIHFIGNTGEIYNFTDFTVMNTNDSNSTANMNRDIDLALEAAESFGINDGEKIEMVSILERRAFWGAGASDENFNWNKSIQHYRTWTYAKVTVETNYKGQKNYNMDMSYNLRDNYRWDEDTHGDLHNMHVYGIAREYKVVGEDKMEISWLNGQRSNEAQILHTSILPQPNKPYSIPSPTPKNY